PDPEDLPPVNHSSRAIKAGIIILAVVVIALLVYTQLLSIRTVRIIGLSSLPQETAISLAGLDRSMFYFTLREEDISRAINANRYLVYQSMEKIFPGTLNIIVIERKPFAFFTHLGVGYILAQDGIILEKTRELRDGSGLILVNGLAVWGQQALGTLPASTDLVQAEILVDLFEQLSVWGFEDQLNNIDITQSMNISMQTKDGFTINLGTAEQLHAKVGTVASVVNALRSRQMSGGIIEATLPGEATYRAQ
ncbi:MAG TPA: FtsQ-type POTRA domain-containing protein, partial [Clostridia bacterium]|nr:FtsQ-type POTRA domain-containing protein [Clostridia bacterium]